MNVDIRDKLITRIEEAYALPEAEAVRKANHLICQSSLKLMKNIQEWAENRSLTEIFVGKYSVPMVMRIWGTTDFLGAVDVLTEYQENDRVKAERKIWTKGR